MASGFTEGVRTEGEGLRKFILRAAQAVMGFHLGDDFSSENLNNAVRACLKPDVKFLNWLNKAEVELEQIERTTDDEIYEKVISERIRTAEFAYESALSSFESRKNYTRMVEQVEGLSSFPESLESLRSFLLEKLNNSLIFDCPNIISEERLAELAACEIDEHVDVESERKFWIESHELYIGRLEDALKAEIEEKHNKKIKFSELYDFLGFRYEFVDDTIEIKDVFDDITD